MKMGGKKLVGWYDETFITLWESSQSDLYSILCAEIKENSREMSVQLCIGRSVKMGKRVFWLRQLMAIQTD